MARGKPFVVVGIDLSGSPRRNTGVCILRGLKSETRVCLNDDDIIESVLKARPALVTMDAPLTLPDDRRTIHDRTGGHFRKCDLELRRRGIRFFPITLGPMRLLTERGIALKKKLERRGYSVSECYPGAAQDVWAIPRQHKDGKGLAGGLRRLGVTGLQKNMTGDELDAVTAALVGRWFLLGRGEMLGGRKGIMMPVVVGAKRKKRLRNVRR